MTKKLKKSIFRVIFFIFIIDFVSQWGLSIMSGTMTLSALSSLNAGGGMLSVYTQAHKDAILKAKDGIRAIKRIGDKRCQQIEQWIKFYKTQQTLHMAKGKQMIVDLKDAQKQAEKGLALLRKIGSNPQSSLNIPHFGPNTIKTLTSKILNIGKSIKELNAKLSDGSANFHLAAIGWITGKALEGKITALQKEVDNNRKKLGDGTFSAYLNSYSWVTEKSLQGVITTNENSIKSITKKYTSGEFSIHIHGVGWTTRNKLESEIAKIEKTIENIGTGFYQGNYAIHRILTGFLSYKAFEGKIRDLTRTIQGIEKNVSQDIWTAHLPSKGWFTGKKIKNAIVSIDKKVKDIKKKVSAGNYSAQLEGLGWKTESAILKAIERELAKKDPNHDYIGKLRKGLGQLKSISALDISLYLLNKSRWTAWMAELLKYAVPYLKSKKIGYEQLTALQGDFSEEVTLHIANLKRTINRLTILIKTYFP